MEQNPSLPVAIADVYTQMGLAGLVGGRSALLRGIEEIQAELPPVLGELGMAAQKNVPLAQAIMDTERYPHLTRIHGLLRDINVIELPEEVLNWAKRVMEMGPVPDAARVLNTVVSTFLRGESAGERLLARFAVFEFLCLGQRWLLQAADVRLEPLGDTRDRVEMVAEQELLAAEQQGPYAAGLLALEDPFHVLTAANAVSMAAHTNRLREELRVISKDVHDRLETRAKLMDVMAAFPPAEAVLIRNGTATVFDEQQLSPEQLRILHPLLLGGVSDDAMYKRVERLPEKVVNRLAGPPQGSPEDKSLSALVVKAMKERA